MTETQINSIFAENLNKLIERKGMTQADVAAAIGVSESAVSLWCAGKTTPRMSKVDKLCELFGCSRAALVERDASPDMLINYNGMQVLIETAKDATPDQIAQAARYLAYLKEVGK